MGGARYFMLMKDEFSSHMFVYLLSSKGHVLSKMKEFINEVGIQTQKRVQRIRSDNGTEFKNQGMRILCQMEGIMQEFSAPMTPQQNGCIERANRTVAETARSILQASELPLALWGEAINTAVYLRNRTTNSHTKDKTPYELFYGRKPDLAHLMRFGEEVHVLD